MATRSRLTGLQTNNEPFILPTLTEVKVMAPAIQFSSTQSHFVGANPCGVVRHPPPVSCHPKSIHKLLISIDFLKPFRHRIICPGCLSRGDVDLVDK